ncbi:MAG: hypothetical protein HEP71_09935 [Roseivirga sp.]|nr:hypothetical protein [Roseivirga sp.]
MIGLVLLWYLSFIGVSRAQAVFESNVSGGAGNWNDSGSWTRISGSDGDDIPDSDDDVTILAGDEIDLTTTTTNVDDLTITGTLDIAGNNRTINVGGNLVMSGTSSITGNNATRSINVTGTFTVNTSASATINGENVDVTGNTTIDGTLTFGNNRGDKSFSNITISATGNWNNTVRESFTISGDWTNNGSFTSCSNQACDYEFTSTSGTFSGSATSTFSDIVINGSASYTNTGTIVISDEIRGTGTYINGNGSSLELQGAGPFGTTTFTVSTSANTVIYGGGSSPSLVATTYHNLTIDKSGGTANNAGTVTVNNDLTVISNLDINSIFNVSNDVIVQSGTLEINGATLTVSRDLSVTGGEFTPNNASAQVDITRDLLMSGSALYDHNLGDVNITGDLTITGGTLDFDNASSTLDADNMNLTTGTVTFDNGTININSLSGGLTVNSGSFDVNGTALTIDNLYDVNGGTNDLDGGSLTVVDIDIEAGDAFTVSNATLVATGTTTINGTLNFDSGAGSYTLDDINVAAGGTWNVTAASDFTINGNIQHNGLAWNACSASGCDYTLTSTSGTISGSTALSVTDIIINGSGSYTNSGTLTVTDRLTGTGAFTNGTSANFTYSGNNSGGANFDITSFTASATGNTVTYGRTGDMQLRTTTDADNNYYNLIISTGAAGNDVTLAGNITVDNQLTLTVGDIILSTNRLTMEDGATISGGDADSFIRINSSGVLRQNYSSSGATLSFPIGDGGDFSPITAFTLTNGTFGAGAYVEFDITDANHPNRNTDNTAAGGDDDGTAATAFISRYWTLTGNAITGERFDATYQYIDADITGIEANMVATLYRGLTSPAIDDWLSAGMVTAGSNTVTLTGGDNFGDIYAMDDTLDRLPIVLISFEGKAVDGKVELTWTTGSEEDNSFFTVERSTNGFDFEPILFVNGAGDSKTFINYTATDVNPEEGLMYYRLKQTDFNGTFSYSELVSVFSAISNIKPDFVIQGNPLDRGQRLIINRNQQGEAYLMIMGLNADKLVDIKLNESESGQLELELPTSIRPGTYMVVLHQQGHRVSKKLIIR